MFVWFDVEVVSHKMFTGYLAYSFIMALAVLSLQEFIEQFRVLLPKDTAASKEVISVLFEKMGLDPTTYQIGKTKVSQSFTFIAHEIYSLFH